MVNLVTCTDNGDGTYTVVFDSPVTWGGNAGFDSAMGLNSPDTESWEWFSVVSQTDSYTIIVTIPSADPGCIQCCFMLQPSYISSDDLLQFATGNAISVM